MVWGPAHTQRWTIDSSIPNGFRLVQLLVGSELCSSKGHEAAAASGASVAAWVRHAACQVIRQRIAQATPEDFPQRWRLAVGERSNGRRGETHEQGHRGT
jgi:hypothetical protein